jgi:Ca2+-binding RTX toxin-like protein
VKASSSHIRVADNNGGVLNFFGVFSYGQSGLSGGTLERVNIYRNGAKLFEIKNASFDILDMVDAVDTGGVRAGVEYMMSGDDKIYGSNLNDKILSYAGNDFLNGRSGTDIMKGGEGDDVYVVDNIRDKVVESFGAGTDTVKSSVNYTLRSNLENLSLKGKSDLKAVGNEGNNELTGNRGDNVLKGLEGDDTLNGKVGNDKIIGGAGNDIIIGGLGDDILSGGADADTFVWYKSDIPDSGVAADDVLDFDSSDGDVIQLADLLSDSSHTLEAFAVPDEVGTGQHLQLSIKDATSKEVQTIDVASVVVTSDVDATNLMNTLLASGAIEDGL